MKQGQAEKSKSRKDIARSTKPIICYAVENLPPKSGSESLYKELRTAVKDGKATLVTKLEIPPCDARSWKVPAGCLFRIICTHGPQVCMYALLYATQCMNVFMCHIVLRKCQCQCFPLENILIFYRGILHFQSKRTGG